MKQRTKTPTTKAILNVLRFHTTANRVLALRGIDREAYRPIGYINVPLPPEAYHAFAKAEWESLPLATEVQKALERKAVEMVAEHERRVLPSGRELEAFRVLPCLSISYNERDHVPNFMSIESWLALPLVKSEKPQRPALPLHERLERIAHFGVRRDAEASEPPDPATVPAPASPKPARRVFRLNSSELSYLHGLKAVMVGPPGPTRDNSEKALKLFWMSLASGNGLKPDSLKLQAEGKGFSGSPLNPLAVKLRQAADKRRLVVEELERQDNTGDEYLSMVTAYETLARQVADLLDQGQDLEQALLKVLDI